MCCFKSIEMQSKKKVIYIFYDKGTITTELYYK